MTDPKANALTELEKLREAQHCLAETLPLAAAAIAARRVEALDLALTLLRETPQPSTGRTLKNEVTVPHQGGCPGCGNTGLDGSHSWCSVCGGDAAVSTQVLRAAFIAGAKSPHPQGYRVDGNAFSLTDAADVYADLVNSGQINPLGSSVPSGETPAPPREKTEEKDHGAGLIHQTIPDVAGTEPRLNKEQLRQRVLDGAFVGLTDDPFHEWLDGYVEACGGSVR